MNNDKIVRIARNIRADYSAGDTPRVYVGTYAKYNNGSIEGKWVDLDDFSDYDEFIEYCKEELHSDEEEPELMFQDYENFPEKYYGESSLKPELWDYIEKVKDYDKDIVDAVIEEGYSLDHVDDAMFYSDCDTRADFAARFIDETGGVENLGRETLESYFDYDSYGRDLEMDGSLVRVNGGMLWIR